MSEWKPIDTAPKDGTEIIGIYFREWDYDTKPTIYGPWTVAFKGKKWRSSWDGQEVISSESDFGTDYKEPDSEPTHWQSMPTPPASSGIRERTSPCPGCDGHECDDGCQYPGVANFSGDRT